MKINGLWLPHAFVSDLQSGRLIRECGSWQLHQNNNAYGEPMETELGYVFEDADCIQKETDALKEAYSFISREEEEKYREVLGVQVGEIPYFWDFSKIVCFAIAGDGSPFCFDFREDEREPKVIWWADAYWLRVAPDYNAFIRLFDIPAKN